MGVRVIFFIASIKPSFICSTQGVLAVLEAFMFFAGLYFKSTIRPHPQSGKLSGYYRLVESYRNADDRICHRTILNVGFMEDTTAEQRNKIQKHLSDKYEHKQTLFEETDPVVNKYVEELWQLIIDTKKLDIVPFDARSEWLISI